MPKLVEHPAAKTTRAAIAPKRVEVAFSLDRPGAREVYLCGDFNQWSLKSLRMVRRGGSDPWEKRLTLAPGRYQYKFIVDGEWIHDPGARETVANPYGSLNSVLEVHP